MTKSNLSPTRMERTRQRERLQTASRAHKLLKDKSEEMIRTFASLSKQNRTLRERVERDLKQAISLYLRAVTQMSAQQVTAALTAVQHNIEFHCGTKNIMGLVVPEIELAASTLPPAPVLLSTPFAFDESIKLLHQLTATLVELANIEKACSLLADEIQKVRRRINSLEYKMIPEIQDTIKFITMKLDENQRETQIRALKVKEMQQNAAE